MADFCTCGAQLPEDARFCHICGKPQRAEDIPQPDAAAVIPQIAPPPPPVPAAFRNGAAVRVGLLSASISLLLSVLLPLPAVAPMGGFFSVYLYRRRTGQSVTALSGARIGWITGLILFAIMASLLILVLVLISSYPGGPSGFAAEMRRSPVPVQKEMLDQFVQFLQSPSKIFTLLVTAFLMINVATIFGGAVGGKLMGKANSGPAHFPQ